MVNVSPDKASNYSVLTDYEDFDKKNFLWGTSMNNLCDFFGNTIFLQQN